MLMLLDESKTVSSDSFVSPCCLWLQEKNKDFVVTEHQTLMASSSLSFIAQLFREALDAGGYS
jgi:hypothetical protein